MVVCNVTDTEPVKLPPLGLIVGVATVDVEPEGGGDVESAFTARAKFVVRVTPPPVPVMVIV